VSKYTDEELGYMREAAEDLYEALADLDKMIANLARFPNTRRKVKAALAKARGEKP
jgi:hypothetical protein